MPYPAQDPPSRGSALPDFVLRQFDRGHPDFDHRQLYGILQRGIRESVLPAGSRLPPSRMLAQALGIARNTVVHVYEQLALEGYVQARVGRGTFVADMGPRLAPVAVPDADQRQPTPQRKNLSRRGQTLMADAGAARSQWGAFTPGVPEVRLFPSRVWSRLQNQLWRAPTPQHLSYATGGGDADLRASLADYLQGTRGVVCTPEQIVITSGTQQSLHLVAQLLADPGDTVWLEDPGYWGARSVFRALGLQPVGVPVDGEGMAPSPRNLRHPPRMMFVSPSHQYPTGAVMSHGRRRQLLDFAAVHGAWVIEDDYDSEFRYGARPLPALQGLDRHGRVIYLGTFSKTLYPALRLAYLVLPQDLAEPFARALGELYREGQSPQQAVLARFMAEGHYTSHIRRMRSIYGARHDALIHAIRHHFGSRLPVVGGDAGLHLVLGLPAELDDRAVVEHVARAKVVARPLSLYHMRQPAPAKGLLLGYGAVHEEDIPATFARLAHAVQQFL
ncbi:MAG: PLP-dependent aminotransferase family protein [Burkholderiaceae bacterium]|nr:PLP-dependent aminotransferase family protein [Rhodoferax sp.]MCB2040860.1 PLP-dependent aminotransferase family protein [Rhodoferax sp.]MCP5261151.1 PLP-dependent aminotransferase family protein [Rhodoferax sp.]MCW5629627.1 PLP-dependent aminotransferase family protein [Rhodoferax sp.]